MNKLKIFLLSFVLMFAIGFFALSQGEAIPTEEKTEEVAVEVIEAVNLDEDIQPEDLEVSEPRLLPDNPFYFLKNWARGIQSVLTFNPVKKAELRMKFTNEKLIEVKMIVERAKDPEKIKKATENYQQEVEKIKNQVDKIKEKAKENPQVESFLDKFIHQQTLHQKLLQKLETQVPPEAFEKIEEARERHLERFQDVMLKLEDREEKITEKLDEILEKQKGSQFKHFKNLEVLLELEEKVPEEAKEAIIKAQENALKRLKGNLESMSPEDQGKFEDYLSTISGKRETHLEIIENLEEGIKEAPLGEEGGVRELKQMLNEGKIKIIQEFEVQPDCPLWTPPAPDFCKEGRIVILKDENGCPLPPKCIELPVSTKPTPLPSICITLWDPVCGKDGKTYSNTCFAKAAEVEINYKGVCEESLPVQPPTSITPVPSAEELTAEGCCTPCDGVCEFESVVGCKRAIENGICKAWQSPCPCPR